MLFLVAAWQGIDIAVDTVHDAPTHVLNSLRLRLIGATELRQPETQVRLQNRGVILD